MTRRRHHPLFWLMLGVFLATCTDAACAYAPAAWDAISYHLFAMDCDDGRP